jgi:anti-sigma regulatory factor (Ser/Thr protein kinase)
MGADDRKGGPARDELRLTLDNDIPSLSRASEAVRGFLRSHEVGPDKIFSADLVLEELVTNIVRHAFDDGATHQIAVQVTLEPGWLVLRIEDDGLEFDLREAPPANLDADLEHRQPGGMGIHLVREIAERIDYRRVGGKNRVEVGIALPVS